MFQCTASANDVPVTVGDLNTTFALLSCGAPVLLQLVARKKNMTPLHCRKY